MTKQLEEKFVDYHNTNPHIYDLFVSFAKEAKKTGKSKYSSYAIFERIRWYMDVETDNDQFKVNNSYRPYYARKKMDEYPEFRGFFNTRKLNT